MAVLTWIDVVDSGVKIVGGALAGGLLTFAVAKSRQNHEMRKARYELEVQTLKDMMSLVDEAADNFNDYSHLSRSITLPSGSDKVKENSELLMSGFKTMTRAKGLAYVIGQTELSTEFENTCEPMLELYYLLSDDLPHVENDVQELLAEASERLKNTNESMRELRIKISECYKHISVA